MVAERDEMGGDEARIINAAAAGRPSAGESPTRGRGQITTGVDLSPAARCPPHKTVVSRSLEDTGEIISETLRSGKNIILKEKDN